MDQSGENIPPRLEVDPSEHHELRDGRAKKTSPRRGHDDSIIHLATYIYEVLGRR